MSYHLDIAKSVDNSGIANVKDFGAVGDGKSDDTQPIRDAIDALSDRCGIVYFPPGHYLTATIKAKSYMTFKGYSSWGYREDSPGSTIVSPLDDSLSCLFDLDGCIGTRIEGLTLNGMSKGKEMHGVFSKHPGAEQNIVMDDCNIANFSGSGVRLDNVWVFAIRRCLIRSNSLSGLDGTSSYDGWIIDNQITGNGRGGIYAKSFASVTITANRIEWNRKGGIVLESANSIQISNCFMDRNFGPGIGLTANEQRFSNISITGNIFRRNGYQQEDDPPMDCHLSLLHAKGIAVTGNIFFGGSHPRDSELGRPASPRYGMILEGLQDSVIAHNSLYHAALKQLVIDKGGHENTIIADNPGSLREPGGIN